MYAYLTEDVEGNVVEKELGLVSWAPSTLTEATRNFKAHPNYGAKYLFDEVALYSGSKRIYHFMPLKGNFAIHSTHLGAPKTKNPLKANGYLDPSGHGCIRIQDAKGNFGGHEFLYDRALSLKKKYGKGKVPIVIDYLPFVDPKVVAKATISYEEVPMVAPMGAAPSVAEYMEVTPLTDSEKQELVARVDEFVGCAGDACDESVVDDASVKVDESQNMEIED
jgi:hypothetical protein